MNIKDSTKS